MDIFDWRSAKLDCLLSGFWLNLHQNICIQPKLPLFGTCEEKASIPASVRPTWVTFLLPNMNKKHGNLDRTQRPITYLVIS